MCAVSVLQDYYRHQTFPMPPNQPWPSSTPMMIQWQPDTWKLYKEILDKLDALDRKLGQPDCEDPAKAAWMRDVEARLAKLEGGAVAP